MTARPERGSMTVEAVVLVPVLAGLAVLAVAAGRYQAASGDLAAAADAAADAVAAAGAGPAGQAMALAAARADTAPAGRGCGGLTVSVGPGGAVPGGRVTVTVTCQASFGDLVAPGVPGTTVLRASRVVPLDPYRAAS